MLVARTFWPGLILCHVWMITSFIILWLYLLTHIQIWLDKPECLRSEIPPAAPWLPLLLIHIRSQVKTRRQSYKFKKIAKNSNFWILQKTWHMTHLLNLLDEYEMDPNLLKPTLGPLKKFQHLTRAEEVMITRLRIGHTKATKIHILSWEPPTTCHCCDQTLTIHHMLLECAVLQESRDEYNTTDSLNTLLETILETCIVEFPWEAGFFCLIWMARYSIQSPTWIIPELIPFLTIN